MSPTEQLMVGARIRFTRTLTEPPCEEHPGRLFAEKGETGTVIECDSQHWHLVKTDNYPNHFWVTRDEIEPAIVPMPSAPLNDGKEKG